MMADRSKLEGEWVPLLWAPFRLQFGWPLPHGEDESELGAVLISGWEPGSAWVFETAAQDLLVRCHSRDDNAVGATFPIGMISYLGMDAALSGAELAARGEIISSERTWSAIETALRLA